MVCLSLKWVHPSDPFYCGKEGCDLFWVSWLFREPVRDQSVRTGHDKQCLVQGVCVMLIFMGIWKLCLCIFSYEVGAVQYLLCTSYIIIVWLVTSGHLYLGSLVQYIYISLSS